MNNDHALTTILPGPDSLGIANRHAGLPHTDNQSALSGITDVLWPGKWLIVACGLLCGIIALLASYFQTPLYLAKTALEIQDLNDNFLQLGDLEPVVKHRDPAESSVQTQIEELTSGAVLSRVVSSLHMDEQFENTKPGRLALIRTRLVSPGTSIDSPKEQAITEARRNLDVSVSRGSSRIVNIQYTSQDPKFAAKFANALAQAFIARGIELRMQSTQRMGEWLQKESDGLRARLQASEDRLQQYGQAQGLLFTDDKNSVAEAKLKQLQSQLSDAQGDRMTKQSKYELVTKTTPEGLAQLTDNGPLRDYELKLTDARQQLAEAASLLTPNHYKVKQLQARVTALEAALARARKELVNQTVSEFETARRREALLNGAYSQQEKLVSGQDAKASRYNILKGEVESNRLLYDSMLQKVKNVSIASAMRASNVAIFDPAEIPTHPFRPRPFVNGMMGSIGGILLSSVFLFLQNRWDRSLRTPGEVSNWLRIPELGAVPSIRNKIAPTRNARLSLIDPQTGNPRFGTAEAPDNVLGSVIANSFRAILASLTVSSAKEHSPQIISVTSARAKEGKTATATNLAITLASIGKRVLLVDGDFVKPSLHQLFDLPEDMGFSDLLADSSAVSKAHLAAYVREVNVTGLSVLTGGSARTQAWSLLYGRRLNELFDQLRKNYEIIIMDTPPVLAVADARLLCREADGTVLVFRAGVTDRESARSAVDQLVSDGTRIYGTILNDFDPRHSRYYKNYYSYAEVSANTADRRA
jgi:capsular exopolysaccharide synthesis family protein